MGACGSKPPLDVTSQGRLVGDPDFGTLKRLKSKVKQLQKATKKAAAKVHPDGAGASEEGGAGASEEGGAGASDLAYDLQALKLFEALVVIKQELHDLPKPSAKDYLPEPTTAIAEMRTLTLRLTGLQNGATHKNVYTVKDRERLQMRLALVERCVTAKEEMLEAAQREYTAQQTVPALRAHARGLDGVIQAALTRNEDVMTTLKLTRWETVKKSTRSYDRRKDWVQRSSEYARLAGVLSCVRLMADSKEAMATATEMGTQIGKDTTLGHARATLDLMTKCLHEAAAAKTQDAPEVPPLKTQIGRVGPIVAAKQEVHNSTVAPVNGQMTVEHLRGPVTQRMLTAKRRAEDIEAWGGPEARALEARLLYVEEMAAAKIACREGMEPRVDPMMTSGELRAVVNNEHAPRLRRAERAGVADSPEYANLLARMKWATGMANSKDEMDRVMAAVCDANTDLADAERALTNLNRAVETAKGVRLEATPQFGRCKARRDEVEGIYRLKHAVHVAAQGGNPRDSIAHLRGRVATEMEAARSAAMQGGAYGGDVERELENRLVVVHNMANGKELAQDALAVKVWADVSVQALHGERNRLSQIRGEVESMHAAGSQEHERLCKFIGEIGHWIDVKGAAQATLDRAWGALNADLSGQVAFLAHHKPLGCTRGNVVRAGGSNVVVHPKDWGGNVKKEQRCVGRDAEGNEQYQYFPIEVTVSRSVCMRGSIEDVEKLRKAVGASMGACQGIGAKGEWTALGDVLHTLDHGRSPAPFRVVEHAAFAAPSELARNSQQPQQPQQAKKKGGMDAIHNPVTRMVAGALTGGASEIYYVGRTLANIHAASKRGDKMGVAKNVGSLILGME